MKPRRLLLACCSLLLAVAGQAQTTLPAGANPMDSTASLPLRNLLIEVRQVERDSGAREQLDASANARVQPGQTDIAVDLGLRQEQQRRSATAAQQVLVLNGRRAAIVLRNRMPLRLLQTFVRNGVLHSVPGMVWLEADSGFDAIPRWDGGDRVELELSAMQSRGNPGSPSTRTSTALVVPLDEWVTVAQSDQDNNGQQSGLSSSARWSSQSRLEIQVRVTLR